MEQSCAEREMRDTSYSGSLTDIIKEIVSYQEIHGAEKDHHFFEVELRRVTRLKNDLLMNEQSDSFLSCPSGSGSVSSLPLRLAQKFSHF